MDTARTYPKGYNMAAVNVDSEELADVVEPLGDHAFPGVELGQPPVLHVAGW